MTALPELEHAEIIKAVSGQILLFLEYSDAIDNKRKREEGSKKKLFQLTADHYSIPSH